MTIDNRWKQTYLKERGAGRCLFFSGHLNWKHSSQVSIFKRCGLCAWWKNDLPNFFRLSTMLSWSMSLLALNHQAKPENSTATNTMMLWSTSTWSFSLLLSLSSTCTFVSRRSLLLHSSSFSVCSRSNCVNTFHGERERERERGREKKKKKNTLQKMQYMIIYKQPTFAESCRLSQLLRCKFMHCYPLLFRHVYSFRESESSPFQYREKFRKREWDPDNFEQAAVNPEQKLRQR